MHLVPAMNKNIDPDLNYCPHCNDEYRAEISTCAACGIDLLSGDQMLALFTDRNRPQTTSRSLEIHPEESVLTVRKGPVLQIKELQAYLLRGGIPSLALKENGAACGCRGVELLLQVRENDLPAVMTALEQEYRHSTRLSDHDTRFAGAVYNVEAAEATCPACGCQFSTSLTACPDCGLCFA
jgi:hypothetical protein